ncbi:MAG: hypothetical protein HC767_01835 [Akkermansiaceae bacterium]|nr:hypothetical protein [Akkermansiaceae bacterium]
MSLVIYLANRKWISRSAPLPGNELGACDKNHIHRSRIPVSYFAAAGKSAYATPGPGRSERECDNHRYHRSRCAVPYQKLHKSDFALQ